MKDKGREIYRYDRTHLWRGGGEMWVCVRCGGSKISLGFWGDDNWRKQHKGWTRPCRGFTEFWAAIDCKEIVKEMKT